MKVVEEQWKKINKAIISRLKTCFPNIDDEELYNIISCYVELDVVNNNSDSIGIGSRFNLTLIQSGYHYTNNYILSESNEPVDNYLVIQPTCPLAQAIIGKKVGDSVKFNVLAEETEVEINEIYKQKVKSKTRKTTK